VSQSPAVRFLSVALTDDERAALEKIAEEQHVSLSVIVRDLLAEEYPQFRKALRPRIVGRPRAKTAS